MPQPVSASARPTIVVLCGSTARWDKLAEANLYETAAGRVVLAPGCNLKEPHPCRASARSPPAPPTQGMEPHTVADDALHLRLAVQRMLQKPGGTNGILKR